EVAAVLGHEVAHIANGDMVTLTLIQGVVNTFVIFLSRVVGYFVDRVLLKNDREVGIGFYVSAFVCEIIFGILASIIVAWFSRQREYRADAGSAALLGSRVPMINALARLGNLQAGELPKNFEAAGIAGDKAISALFASHPPIESRIQALQAMQRVKVSRADDQTIQPPWPLRRARRAHGSWGGSLHRRRGPILGRRRCVMLAPPRCPARAQPACGARLPWECWNPDRRTGPEPARAGGPPRRWGAPSAWGCARWS